MTAHPAPSAPSAPPDTCPARSLMPLAVAADLQDHLITAGNDLARLQRLLGDAGLTLMASFQGAAGEIDTLLRRPGVQAGADAPALHAALRHLSTAITAMQFQDLASQLVEHTTRRLRSCADRLAAETLLDDEDGAALVEAAPLRPNPVTQDEMDAGAIELF